MAFSQNEDSYLRASFPTATSALNSLTSIWQKAKTSVIKGTFSQDFNEIPTHAQSLILHRAAMDLLEKIREKGGISDALKNTPIYFITGTNDPACNNDNILEVVNILKEAGFNVKHKEFNTGHNSLQEFPDAQDFFAQACKDVAQPEYARTRRHAAPAQETNNTFPPPMREAFA